MEGMDPREWSYAAVENPPQAAWAAFQSYLDKLGFESTAFVFDNPYTALGHPRENMFGIRVSPEYEAYLETAPIEYDFGVPAASRRGRQSTVTPHRLLQTATLSDLERQFVGGALELGLNCGWTVPITDRFTRRFSVLLLSSSGDEHAFLRCARSRAGTVSRATVYFHEGLRVRKLLADNPDGVALTQRQEDCLAWASAGKTAKEIGDLLCIAESTASEYLADATRKLGASNRTQAVARAMLLGLIRP